MPNSAGLFDRRRDQSGEARAVGPSDVEGPFAPTTETSNLVPKEAEKGYSIYVVDDEHEIHRFDLDTYEWSIITTTKDMSE